MFACSKYAPEDEVTRPLDNNFTMNLRQCYYLLYILEEVNGDRTCNHAIAVPKFQKWVVNINSYAQVQRATTTQAHTYWKE